MLADLGLLYCAVFWGLSFPTMKILNGMYSTMKLENIPLEANGWKVYCRYTNNAGSADTASALITVKSAP